MFSGLVSLRWLPLPSVPACCTSTHAALNRNPCLTRTMLPQPCCACSPQRSPQRTPQCLQFPATIPSTKPPSQHQPSPPPFLVAHRPSRCLSRRSSSGRPRCGSRRRRGRPRRGCSRRAGCSAFLCMPMCAADGRVRHGFGWARHRPPPHRWSGSQHVAGLVGCAAGMCDLPHPPPSSHPHPRRA